MHKLIQKAIELHQEKHNIVEGKTAQETIKLNTPTIEELTALCSTFQLEGTTQYQIVRIFRLLEYLAKKIDNL